MQFAIDNTTNNSQLSHERLEMEELLKAITTASRSLFKSEPTLAPEQREESECSYVLSEN